MSTTGNVTWPRRKKPEIVDQPKRRYLRWILGSLFILLVSGLGIAWATGYFNRDPRLAAIDALRERLSDQSLTEEQRRKLLHEMFKNVRDLPESEQRQVFNQGRGDWEKRERKKMADFFAMSLADQQAYLRKKVEEMLQRQKEREERRKEEQAANGNAADGNSQNGGSGQGGPGGQRGQGSRGSRTDEQRLASVKRYLASSDPTTRAQRGVYSQMLQQTAQQMGLPLKMSRAVIGR